MRKQSFTLAMLLLLTSLFALVSCDAVIGASEKRAYTGYVTEDSERCLDVIIHFQDFACKSLSVSSDAAPVSYKYKAICLSNSGAYGTKDTLTELTSQDGKAKIILVPGTWNITICGYNSNDGLVLEGSSGNVNLSSAVSQVDITLSGSNGEGSSSVIFNIGTPVVAGGQVEIRYADTVQGVFGKSVADKILTSFASGQDAFESREGFAKFTDTMNIPSGTYFMQLLYTDGLSKVSGQILGFKAVEKTPVEITGNFDYGLYVKPDLDIAVQPAMLEVELTGTAPEFTARVLTSETRELTYMWIVNGDEILTGQTTESLSWTPEECGFYNITCIVSGKVGENTLYGFAYGVYEKNS